MHALCTPIFYLAPACKGCWCVSYLDLAANVVLATAAQYILADTALGCKVARADALGALQAAGTARHVVQPSGGIMRCIHCNTVQSPLNAAVMAMAPAKSWHGQVVRREQGWECIFLRMLCGNMIRAGAHPLDEGDLGMHLRINLLARACLY